MSIILMTTTEITKDQEVTVYSINDRPIGHGIVMAETAEGFIVAYAPKLSSRHFITRTFPASQLKAV